MLLCFAQEHGRVYQSILHAPESDKYVLYERTLVDDTSSTGEIMEALFGGGGSLKHDASPFFVYGSLAPLAMIVWVVLNPDPGFLPVWLEVVPFIIAFVYMAGGSLASELSRRSEGVYEQHARVFDSQDDLRDALRDTEGLSAEFQPDVLR